MIAKMDGEAALRRFRLYLARFIDLRLLRQAIVFDGRPLATFIPIATRYRCRPVPLSPAKNYALSRFACCRREGDQMILASPMSDALVILHVLALPSPSESTGRNA